MTTLLNDAILNRLSELGFSKKHALDVKRLLQAEKRVWIVNDNTDLFSFVRCNSDAKLLQKMKLWPK